MGKSLCRNPLLPVVVIVLAGILCADACQSFLSLTMVTTAGGLSLLMALAMWRRTVGQCFVLLPWLFLGMCAVLMAERHYSVSVGMTDGLHEMVVVEEPVVGTYGTTAVAELVSGKRAGRKVRVTWTRQEGLNSESPVALGDGLVACGRLRPVGEIRNEGFRRYLKVHGIAFVCQLRTGQYQPKMVSLAGLSRWDRVVLSARLLRRQWVARLKSSGLSGQELAVVAAMTVGDKSRLSSNTKSMFTAAGTSHLLALSGTHLAILYTVLSLLLRDLPLLLGRGRLLLCELVSLSIVWMYVFFVGLSPSVVRAAMMITVLSLTRMTGRGRDPFNTLSLVALLMLAVDPLSVFDVSFQLSFLSVMAIVTLVPLFDKWLTLLFPSVYSGDTFIRRQPFVVRYVLMATAVSLAAQMGTVPLVLYHFGVSSTCFIVSNWLSVPLATAILYLSVAFFAAVSLSAPVLFTDVLSTLLSWSAVLLMRIHEYVATLPFALVGPVHVNLFQTFLMYVVMALLLAMADRTIHCCRKSSERP